MASLRMRGLMVQKDIQVQYMSNTILKSSCATYEKLQKKNIRYIKKRIERALSQCLYGREGPKELVQVTVNGNVEAGARVHFVAFNSPNAQTIPA